MLEDRLLVWRLRRGNAEALRRIYEKYRDDLLRLAVSLSNDPAAAEDIVHDVFVLFIHGAGRFRLSGSLRSYLATCVANRTRNANRARRTRRAAGLEVVAGMLADIERPDQWIVCSEELRQVAETLAQLPAEQREAITLHLQGGMKFREIAAFQDVPLKTALSRYRGGLQRLRTQLNDQVQECDP